LHLDFALKRDNATHALRGAHEDFLRAAFRGTRAPARRASDNPMAMACLRLVTFLRERPLRSVPRFISSIARFTFRPLDLPYLRAMRYSIQHCLGINFANDA
jgi:hypothetical protein